MDKNTLAFRALSRAEVPLARSQTVAMSVKLSALQHVMLAVGGGGPTFPEGQEPVADGVAYTATDGVAYYRPHLAVAPRPPGRRPGPDVWFLKDDAGDISLQWTLHTVPFGGTPSGAVPLPFTISSVRMEWAQGAFDFPAPGVEPVEDRLPDQPAFRIHGGAAILREKAAELEAAMNRPDSACRLTVTYGYDYTVQVPTGSTPPPEPEPRGPTGLSTAILGSFSKLRVGGSARLMKPHLMTAALRSDAVTAALAQPAAAAPAPVSASPMMLRRRVAGSLRDVLAGQRIIDIISAQPVRPENRSQTVMRSVPFVFEPSDEQNRPIYRSLHGAANLTDAWVRSEAGWMCASEFPNTVNRLPDDLRLAWDVELGGPHMVPTLHRNVAGDMRVRLLVRLAPYHDPRHLDTVRRLVSMPAAHIVIGEVERSTLRLGGSFPEELAVVGDAGAPAALTGMDLTLDLSLAYYQLFCQQITTPVGVPGTVDVVLATAPPADEASPVDGGQPGGGQQTTAVPVTLRLDRVDDLPCTVALPETPSPTTVTVTNASGSDITIGGASVTLLQVDEESVVPVDTSPGRCTTTFPVTIAAGGSVELALAPSEEDETPQDAMIWNGVLIELLDKRLVTTPSQMLRHVHELAGATDMSRDLTITSPVFSTGTVPERWPTLVSIEVEVTAPGAPPTSVVLSPTAPSRTLAARVTLHDVASGTPGGISAVTYRVRNNYTDHQGSWTEPQQQSGSDLVVYPSSAPGD